MARCFPEVNLPYSTQVEPITTISRPRIPEKLMKVVHIPFGVNVLLNLMISFDLAVTTERFSVR